MYLWFHVLHGVDVGKPASLVYVDDVCSLAGFVHTHTCIRPWYYRCSLLLLLANRQDVGNLLVFCEIEQNGLVRLISLLQRLGCTVWPAKIISYRKYKQRTMVLRRLYRTCVWDLMLLVQTVIGADFRGPLSHNLARKSGEEEGRTSILALHFFSLLTYCTCTHRHAQSLWHRRLADTVQCTSGLLPRCSLSLSYLACWHFGTCPRRLLATAVVMSCSDYMRYDPKRLSGEGVQQCQRVDAGEALFLPASLAGGIS